MPILMSIKPKYSQQIFSGQKKYELRKTALKKQEDNVVIVYESAPTKAIVGFFIIKAILRNSPRAIWDAFKEELGISREDFFEYFKEKERAYAIKISHPEKFKRTITLQELRKIDESWRPPQSYYYIKEDTEVNILLKSQLVPQPTLLSFT